MSIDVLIPSRGRPEKLKQSIQSLFATCAWPSMVKIHVAADDDDPATAEVCGAWAHVRCLVMPREGYDRLHVYYQRLAVFCEGDWLLVWNDDARMLTSQWDAILGELPPGVLVADLMTPLSPLCCFPAVRAGAVAALGMFSTDNPHVDTFWQDAGGISGTIQGVQIYAGHDGQVRPGQTHGFYDPPHQAQLAAAAIRLKEYANGLRDSH
jgi:hypothetical protein